MYIKVIIISLKLHEIWHFFVIIIIITYYIRVIFGLNTQPMIETLTNIFGTRMSFVLWRDILYNEKREREGGVRHRICMASLVTGREVHRPNFFGVKSSPLSGWLFSFFLLGDHCSLVSFLIKDFPLILNNYHLC